VTGRPDGDGRQDESTPLESTATLLDLVRGGDSAARERLFGRFLPLLESWAHRRLPGYARGLAETDDLVQLALLRAFKNVESFQSRHEGAFLAFLRTTLMNEVRDELRRTKRAPSRVEMDVDHPDQSPSILEQTIGRERLDRYERALATLLPEQHQAVILRIEFDYSHQQIAAAMGKPSADAARKLVARALVVLAKAIEVD
jgi:RNA polymerase sigma-70 factor (ECF subfamily)